MLKSVDVPKELKNFNSLFHGFEGLELSRVFDDFLTVTICAMARGTEEELYLQTIKPYKRKELDIFCQLFAELVLIYERETTENGIFDPLGIYYECLASNYKKSNFGQFFTPVSICKMLAQMVIDDDFGKTINEPCCGSGRMILAANQVAKGNYYICQDLDPICCKMTAINLCFHKINAEIYCMDTLRMDKPRFVMATNYELWKNKTLSILYYKTP